MLKAVTNVCETSPFLMFYIFLPRLSSHTSPLHHRHENADARASNFNSTSSTAETSNPTQHMAEIEDDGLLGIEVDTDDYAETAAGDTPSLPRTFQSEADFQAQKASYSPKIYQGNIYNELIKTVPILAADAKDEFLYDESKPKLKLSKKEIQLLGYAVGEMYFDRKYREIIELCERVRVRCDVHGDKKLGESLERWVGRCVERERKGGNGKEGEGSG